MNSQVRHCFRSSGVSYGGLHLAGGGFRRFYAGATGGGQALRTSPRAEVKETLPFVEPFCLGSLADYSSTGGAACSVSAR